MNNNPISVNTKYMGHYLSLRKAAVDTIFRYTSLLTNPDGYNGQVHGPIIVLEESGLHRTLNAYVTIEDPPPGAVPTLVKMLDDALAEYAVGPVYVGTVENWAAFMIQMDQETERKKE